MTFGITSSLIALPPKQTYLVVVHCLKWVPLKSLAKWLRMSPAKKINSALITLKFEQVWPYRHVQNSGQFCKTESSCHSSYLFTHVILYLLTPGGYLGFQVTGMIKGFFWVWKFWYRDFWGYENLACIFWGSLIWVGIFWGVSKRIGSALAVWSMIIIFNICN